MDDDDGNRAEGRGDFKQSSRRVLIAFPSNESVTQRHKLVSSLTHDVQWTIGNVVYSFIVVVSILVAETSWPCRPGHHFRGGDPLVGIIIIIIVVICNARIVVG